MKCWFVQWKSLVLPLCSFWSCLGVGNSWAGNHLFLIFAAPIWWGPLFCGSACCCLIAMLQWFRGYKNLGFGHKSLEWSAVRMVFGLPKSYHRTWVRTFFGLQESTTSSGSHVFRSTRVSYQKNDVPLPYDYNSMG